MLVVRMLERSFRVRRAFRISESSEDLLVETYNNVLLFYYDACLGDYA
jgi:hypothetical protein